MKHIAINEPNPANLQFGNTPAEFNENLLIYPEELEKCNPRGKSPTGLDGLSVYDTLKINNRAKARLFSLFLMLHRLPDILLNSYTIFIPKKEETNDPASLSSISISQT